MRWRGVFRARGVAIFTRIHSAVPAIWFSAITNLITVVGVEARRRPGGILRFVLPACFAGLVAGCATHQTGPARPITIEDDVTWMRALSQPQPEDLMAFAAAGPTRQAGIRNEVVTARMYIADMQYHQYEAQLTKELQEEGLVATLTSLGLTTSATLLTPAATKTILSGIATAVTGADKAFNDKVLLTNTIQALQTQMRADRKEQAATIYARMFKSPGAVTPITEYTLPMALSDVDAYYQAGTIASALIGISKTLSAKETSSDEAKASVGPNASKVTTAKAIASPTRTKLIVDPTVSIPTKPVVVFPDTSNPEGETIYEKRLTKPKLAVLRKFACDSKPSNFAALRGEVLTKLKSQRSSTDLHFNEDDWDLVVTEIRGNLDAKKDPCPSVPTPPRP